MIGMVMLMGLVTKNAILLVDFTNLLRRRGMNKNDALRKAGPTRLRPILMTAFSTIAGMFPITLGMGDGAESRAPMGTCVVGGMLTSTVLTLVVIPVVYSLIDDFSSWFSCLFGFKPNEDSKKRDDLQSEVIYATETRQPSTYGKSRVDLQPVCPAHEEHERNIA